MASPIKEQKYSSIRIEDADLENDSDTTLGSEGFLEKRAKRQRHRCRKPGSQSALTWFRWTIVVMLQSVVIFLLLRDAKKPDLESTGWSQADTETGGDINGLYIPSKNGVQIHNSWKRANIVGIASHKYTLLLPDEEAFVPNMTSNDNRLEIRNNWDKLMPR
jgi:hypothetical protein